MDAEVLARWQFGITTVYHFILVPLTIGLAPLLAIMQTLWFKTGKEHWLRLTKFFGKLFLINFALGVATGIVQEFQFGMNWSEYARMVGDIFGAPLAMEALGAFFIESTFIGLWVFGWQRLRKGVHLACIWLVAFGVNLSAFFIISANSFMQHQVGATYNPATGRAEMADFVKVVTNPTAWAAFLHVVATAFLVAASFVAGVCAYWIVKATRAGNADLARNTYRPALRLGALVMIIAGVAIVLTGDWQGKLMYQQQPSKMSAAEAVCDTGGKPVPFSILSIGNFTQDCTKTNELLKIPGLTSFLATNSFTDTSLKGTQQIQAEQEKTYGATVAESAQKRIDAAQQLMVKEGKSQDEIDKTVAALTEANKARLADNSKINYIPNLFVTYWTFRLMIGLAVFSVLLALGALWYTRKKNNGVTDSKLFKWIGIAGIAAPFLAASFGWIFTEMGRQPWIVAPNPEYDPTSGEGLVRMLTAQGVSTTGTTGAAWVLITMIGFTLIYAILGVFWFRLIKRYASAGAGNVEAPDEDKAEGPLSFAY